MCSAVIMFFEARMLSMEGFGVLDHTHADLELQFGGAGCILKKYMQAKLLS